MSSRFADRFRSITSLRPRISPLHINSAVLVIALFILLLHVVGWTTLIAVVAPLHLSVGSGAVGAGIGITAYTLGMRHAFDADHIAAIDNTTRKLVGEGRPASSVGFWFSLGHSTIVFGLTLLVAIGAHSLSDHVASPGSLFHTLAGLIGTSVSGGFLYLIALLNLASFFEIFKVFRRLKAGQYEEAHLERQLSHRGVVSRLLAPLMRLVHRPAQMYFVGLLFGLGFDTATEIALLVLTGSGAASGLPWYGTLCIPILFAAGMLLFDTIDGSFMNVAYGWALAKPVRKIYYNLVVTGLSVAVAVGIGTVELLGLFGHARHPHDGFWAIVSRVDLNDLGFGIVALFVFTWLVSVAIWKFGRIEERWSPVHRHSFWKSE
ncbi:HoxN/HupN/NixA family nickel/cobalt transporter [Paraburkholderia hospita]|uniref:Nickel/cobalt efflux system n=1 Tax=Paraburkholderia hospita TaxID=169430 RepID=A0ABN0FBN9_9BURK|nr:HoxN/HupN/NixA family nickel/cobalt transporter [Paraburkholderia hospita]EIM96031.1 high-affinity nickel-transporter [Paraburkholderia hospita]OUL75428.1 HoxN/HupN/NixA family nickel/cobalt transporter [Paraburkholderia hospita]SEI26851.1 high-affinity nickel-transport protein [Paraburkholderia hospita]